MADNIKIVGNILSTTIVSRYSSQDTNLIASRKLQENFGGTNDYIEYYVYDIGGNLLSLNYSYLNYKLPASTGLTPGVTTSPNTTGNIQTTDVGVDSVNTTTTSSLYPIIEIDPVKDLQDLGYSSGEFQVRYNLFQNKISDFSNEALFVKEISQDRTEIRLASTTLTNEQIESGSLALIDKINNSNYYVDYLLNFGTNEQYVAVNVALNKDPGGYEILFKLYQPLPLSVQEKQTLWIVEEKVNPYVFDINLDRLITPLPPPQLRGPNFNIQVENQGTISTTYGSYSSLISSLQSLQSSSYNQIQSLLATQSIDINVDYTDFNDFVFFGSAEQRVKNFYTKVKEIEDYNSFINTYTSFIATTASLQTTINQYSSSISNIISQFDGYEYYLYFESSSYTWPKSGSNKPFTLLSTGSAAVISWYNTLTGSAENYDETNYDNLEFAVPAFIKDDGNNQPFLLFLNMVGQYFDNIWIYIQSVTDINLANNNLEAGISKDLVYQQLKSLGVKLYNSQAGDSVNGYLIGANTGSSVFDNNFTITGSYLNNIPRKDLVSELYKRIYHNLPLLLKTKGTVAGLDYLMTTFGIPNQTYYVITSGSISSSFYTPTGSNSTASILSVKEFGGSLKSGLTRGYNNDKVRIVSNTITGSVLSSELSLQTFPTASAAFRDDDLHYVDISFSPETQIDTYISKSIAANTTTWSLDDYIGDPRQQYSASYPDLDAQRKLYFETGVGSYPGFTGSLLDYNGFIRLIEYFDNSLFKMLADFVPERASLSTGVTINSPVLERNKVVYSVPNVSKENIKDADYEIGEITPQYGKLYSDLSGDKKPFFTGELSGSVIDVNQYFEDDFNPYDGDWDVYNSQHTISESIDMNKFLHSDWNVLLNNVSQSVTSSYRKKIEYIYGTTGSLTSSAELQDSYLTLKSYNTSRYDGSKVTSLLYNTYTSGSYTGSDGRTIVTGDSSFGKTAALDRNSYKVAWVKNIPSQSLNFYDKTSINLKYLVDANNNLTELSRGNLNLSEVQRTFRSGDPVILSISDVKNPSNQTTLDGTKIIFKGGYSYDPILFRENNEPLYFIHDNFISSSIARLGIKAFSRDAFRYFSYIISPTGTDGINSPPTVVANGIASTGNTGGYVFTINNVSNTTDPMSYRSFTYNEWTQFFVNPAPTSISRPLINFTLPSGDWNARNYNRSTFLPNNLINTNIAFVYAFDILNFNDFNFGGYNTEPDRSVYSPLGNSTYNYYKVPRTSTYKVSGSIPIDVRIDDYRFQGAAIKLVGLVMTSTNPTSQNPSDWSIKAATQISVVSLNGGTQVPNIGYNFVLSDNPGPSAPSAFSSFNLNLNDTLSLTTGEYVRFQLYLIDGSNIFGNGGSEGTTGINFLINSSNLPNRSFFEIYDNSLNTTQYQFTSSYSQPVPFFTASSSNTLVFNSSASYLFTTASTFIPQPPAANYYSPVVDYFGIQKYDILRIGSFNSPIYSYYEITNVSASSTQYYITLDRNIESSSYNNAVGFAFLRPKPDETSVIVNFKKSPGEVSQTILVPYDANDAIKGSLGNIFKTLNTDLQ